MKIKIQCILGALILMMAPIAKGQDFSYTVQGGQTLYFNINGNNATVTRPADSTLPYFTQLGNLVIPEMVEYNNVQYAVTAIDSVAFAGCSGLTQITIPVSITTFGAKAFNTVPDLTRSNYAGTLAQWCSLDFESSSANPISASGNLYINESIVTTNSFTDNIPEIKGLTFAGCTSLEGTLTVPASTAKIGYGAFYLCTGLTSVSLPSTIREIESNAFRSCSSLNSINLPEGLLKIGDLAFSYCTNLQQITIPRTVVDLGYNTFNHCPNLHTVWFNADSCRAGKYEDNLIFPIFGSSCTSLTSIIFGDNVKVIPDYAFSFCRKITNLVFPDSVVSIGKMSFQTCDLLTTVTFGKNVQSIGDSAFGWCSALWRFNMRCTTPPIYGLRSLHSIGDNVQVFVPCSAVATYENNGQWGMFDIEGYIPYTLDLASDDESKGIVSLIESASCANPVATVKATALNGYIFSHWNDGNTSNPRQVVMNQDVSLTAHFVGTNGIGQASNADDVLIYTKDRNIIVVTETSKTIYIYDLMGHLIASFDVCGQVCHSMPYSGVFLVKADNKKVSKVVVY